MHVIFYSKDSATVYGQLIGKYFVTDFGYPHSFRPNSPKFSANIKTSVLMKHEADLQICTKIAPYSNIAISVFLLINVSHNINILTFMGTRLTGLLSDML